MPTRGQRPAPQGRGLRELLRKLLVGRDGHGGLGACLGQGRLPAQVMQHGSPVQGNGETQGVGELLGQGQRRLAAGHRLVGVPEEPEGRRRAIAATHPRVVPAVERGMGAVPLRIIEPQPLFLVHPGGGQLAASEQAGPQGVVGLEQEVRVLRGAGPG